MIIFHQRIFISSSNFQDDLNVESSFLIFPNPTTSHLFIKSLDKSHSKLFFKIYNTLGQIEKRFLMDSSLEQVFELEIDDLNGGVYFIYFENEKGRSGTKRIIIQD